MSKYEALFARTPGARELQRTVVEEARLDNSFDLLEGKIHDVVGGLPFDGGVDLELITAFAKAVDRARECKYDSARRPFANLFNDVYPAYLEAMTTRGDYYLSDIELLALARCTGQNVALFVHSLPQRKLIYTRSYVGGPALPVVATSLLDRGEQGAVRTHFQRLRVCSPGQLPGQERSSSAAGQRAAEENYRAAEANKRSAWQDDGSAPAKRARTDAEVSHERPGKEERAGLAAFATFRAGGERWASKQLAPTKASLRTQS